MHALCCIITYITLHFISSPHPTLPLYWAYLLHCVKIGNTRIYSKNTILGILRDAQKILKKYFWGEPTRPKILNILPGIFLEYFWNKIEIPREAAAEGRHSIFYSKNTPKNTPGSIFRVFLGELALPRSIFWVFFLSIPQNTQNSIFGVFSHISYCHTM